MSGGEKSGCDQPSPFDKLRMRVSPRVTNGLMLSLSKREAANGETR